jgi:hypothetical protein
MENEYMKRGYLLPDGCKDLMPIAKPERNLEALAKHLARVLAAKTSMPFPPITKQVVVPPKMTVVKLAALLGQKPFRIHNDLMKLGIFAALNDLLEFYMISDVAKMHGFLAIRAG